MAWRVDADELDAASRRHDVRIAPHRDGSRSIYLHGPDGVAVERASVFFRINNGNLIQVATENIGGLDLDTAPTVSRTVAMRIAEEAVKLLRSTIPASIQIDAVFESRSMVMADPTQIHQIVMNLCTNSFQALKGTGGQIRIMLNQMALDGSAAELLGITRPTLYDLLNKYGLSAESYSKKAAP